MTDHRGSVRFGADESDLPLPPSLARRGKTGKSPLLAKEGVGGGRVATARVANAHIGVHA
jgi:hypothetical protein